MTTDQDPKPEPKALTNIDPQYLLGKRVRILTFCGDIKIPLVGTVQQMTHSRAKGTRIGVRLDKNGLMADVPMSRIEVIPNE